MASTGLIVSLAASAAALIWTYKRKDRIEKLPPGPPSYPLLGQLLSAPTSLEQLKYKALADDLKSDIISLQFLGKTIVVLGSAQAAIDLFEKRSTIYSDRPQTIMLTHKKLVDWENAVLFTQYGDRLRAYRRIFTTWLSKPATRAFHDHQTAESRKLLRQFIGFGNEPISSEAIEKGIARLTAATLLHASYGYKVDSLDDPFVVLAKRMVDITASVALPSNFLVNIFPSLLYLPEWVPGTGWRKLAREWRADLERAANEPFEWTKNQIAAGVARRCIVRSVVESLNGPDMNRASKSTEEDCKQVALTLFGGGSDTMAGTLMSFILAMALFPEAQMKAQREIDSVIGKGRLPEINDQDKLPYVRNLIEEVIRWRPVLPLGVPHACSEDDVFRGYFIPRGSIVYVKYRAMTRDEKIYKNPETFDPDRFLDRNMPSAPAFGWGRRKCPGTHFADSLIFICVASVLAAFNIKGMEDVESRDPLADIPVNGIVYRPKPFSCIVSPRSKAHEELIYAATDESM
ncbi:cytochrome P450 family protein [Ceratobasidium sp. AG-Ba]|nr:cytochrome P450 family protein [Ceratobasidium sp. AG-Ba]